MLDLKWIREHRAEVQAAIHLKRVPLDLDALFAIDQEVVSLQKTVQALQEKRNATAKSVSQTKDSEERKKYIQEAKEINTQLEEIKPNLDLRIIERDRLLAWVPNIPHPAAPVGPDETANKEIYRSGPTEAKKLSHIDILHLQSWSQNERISHVCGSRSYALSGDAVLLEMALLRFAMEKMQAAGFTPITVPPHGRETALVGTGHFPAGRDQVYKLEQDTLFLSGTAEVPILSLHAGEILPLDRLPILYAGISPCFRREAGSAGKDVKGLIRVHQFQKVEQFVICEASTPEAEKWHQKLLSLSESILSDLELPYRVIECCTGDMGAGKVRMYDIEAWVPSEKTFRETHSCSSLTDWQARRVQLRYRDAEGIVRFCYTLNNTALASPRILVPFLENHQTPEGRIHIPLALQPYMNGREFLGKPVIS